MLSMAFKDVRGLPRSPDGSAPSEEKGVWSIHVQHGAQRHSIELSRAEKKRDVVGTSGSGAQRGEEVEIFDKEGQETVEISLVFEGEPAGAPRFGWSNNRRRRRRHANATVEMGTFRSRPEESVTIWLPLRSVSSNCEKDSGAVQVKFTYTDDCMAQGYLFALFCGLVPLSLPNLCTGDIPVEPENVAIKKNDIPDDLPSTPPPSAKTKSKPSVAPGKEKVPSTGATLPLVVSQVPVSPQESPRRVVQFGPASELVFQDCVEARAA